METPGEEDGLVRLIIVRKSSPIEGRTGTVRRERRFSHPRKGRPGGRRAQRAPPGASAPPSNQIHITFKSRTRDTCTPAPSAGDLRLSPLGSSRMTPIGTAGGRQAASSDWDGGRGNNMRFRTPSAHTICYGRKFGPRGPRFRVQPSTLGPHQMR
jgi:hypothetical protein